VAAGAPIIEPIENKPWNVREYTVRDCNGHHRRFGPTTYERPVNRTGALPAHIRIDASVPGYDTYVSLFHSVDWSIDEASMRPALAHAHHLAFAKSGRRRSGADDRRNAVLPRDDRRMRN
jgi:hypothetical protein